MGRDVTGVRGELNKSPYAKVRATVSADTDREVNQKLPDHKEVKDCEVNECTSEAPRAENSLDSLAKQVVATKRANSNTEKLEIRSAKTNNQKSSSPEKQSSGGEIVEKLKIENTSQEPLDVTIDKQVCESPITVETPDFQNGKNVKSPSSSKKSMPSTLQVTRKLLDDDDNWSMTSFASVRTTRSRTTVAVAPTFSISDRLEKRKEYYARLEEKRKSMEAEKQEYEARTKEEEEAAIKQLRKNMKFKANPVPSFYYEKPSPKKEIKKLPTTHAISPTFGRRKSFNDAIRSSPEEKMSGRALRHSISGHLPKDGSTPTSAPKTKSRLKPVRETLKQPAS